MPPTHPLDSKEGVGDNDEKRGDWGCCELGSYQHRYGDDGERADTNDLDGDYENSKK